MGRTRGTVTPARTGVLLTLLMLSALACVLVACPRARPECTVEVVPESSKISRGKLTTEVRVAVTGAPRANVYLDYVIHYRSEKGEELEEPGIENKRLQRGQHLLVLQQPPLQDAAEILSVEIREMSCSP